MVAGHVAQFTASDVHFDVHAGAVPSLVKFSNHPQGGKEGVLGIVRSAKKEQKVV